MDPTAEQRAATALAVATIVRAAAEQASATIPQQRTPWAGAGAGPISEAVVSGSDVVVAAGAPRPEALEAAETAESFEPAVPDAAPGGSAETSESAAPGVVDTWPSPRRQIAIAVRILCALVVAVLLGHRFIPDVMGIGSLIDTFLPWTFVPVLVAVPAALVSRSRSALALTALAAAVWAGDFGPRLLASGGSGPADLRVLSQNVSARNPDVTGVAKLAVARDADLVVLQGLDATDLQAADAAAPPQYRYHLTMAEFSVWSKYPLSDSRPVDLGSHGDPAQAVAPATPAGAVTPAGQQSGLLQFTLTMDANRITTVYAVHLPQPSLSHTGFGHARATALSALETAISRETDHNLVVVGDLDLAATDRGMSKLLNDETALVSAQAEVGTGFGFTWPSDFPVVRLDDVLSRGLKPVRSSVLDALGTEQAHRPIEVDLRF